jgi:hypothetical protein
MADAVGAKSKSRPQRPTLLLIRKDPSLINGQPVNARS